MVENIVYIVQSILHDFSMYRFEFINRYENIMSMLHLILNVILDFVYCCYLFKYSECELKIVSPVLCTYHEFIIYLYKIHVHFSTRYKKLLYTA